MYLPFDENMPGSKSLIGFSDRSVGLSGKTDPGVMVLSCIDPRLNETLANGALQGAVVHRNGGGVVAAGKDAALDFATLFAPEKFAGLQTLLILGHTDCGAINALTNAILKEVSPGHDSAADWALSLSDEAVTKAARHAAEKGATQEEINGAVEQLMPLVSAKRLLERVVTKDGERVILGDVLKAHGIELLPALYDVESKTLQQFNFKTGQYAASKLLEGELSPYPRKRDALEFYRVKHVEGMVAEKIGHSIKEKLKLLESAQIRLTK